MNNNDKRFNNNNRANDYVSSNRYSTQSKCVVCHNLTYFRDRICGKCRSEVPEHIPADQVKRYIQRIKKGRTK